MTANTQDALSDDLNYETWAQTTKTTLIEKGLWDVVENGVPPDPSKIPELATTIHAEELSKWRDLAVKDMKALQILQSSLTGSSFRKTLSSSSAKDVWDLLKKGNEEATVSRLEKQFEQLKRYEGESVDSYIDRIMGIVEQLRRLKIDKSEYQICMKVFTSLPGSFDRMASVLKELMDVHNMTCMSLGLYFNFHGYEFDSVTEEDFIVLLNDLRVKSKSEKWCDVWYKENHIQEDCKIRNEEEDEIVVEYKLSTEVGLGDLTYDEDIWMICAKATIHMTPYEKYFTTLDRTHRAGVELADGRVIMVEGRGDVKIMMKGGKKKTIKNVLFVPKLNRNVLSLSQIASRGYLLKNERGDKYIIRDRTGEEFGETMFTWDEKRLALRLKVVEGNLTS